jgi:hypothetical protein
MIRDIIELPSRHMSGELNTVVPKFTYTDMVDDIDWYGRIVDLDNLQDICKYKLIETVNNCAIERVFMTLEPIDFKAKWITSKIRIFPVFYRVFHWPHQGKADVYRYLTGTTDILDICSLGNWNQQTIYDRVFDRFDYLPWVSDQDKELSRLLVDGNDEKNIEWLADCNLLVQHYDGRINEPVATPTFNKDLSSQMFLRDLDCSDLKPMLSRDFGSSCANQAVQQIQVPFEIDQDTLFSMDENYVAKWPLHRLLYLLDSSIYTDISIELDTVTRTKTKSKVEMFSRYIGVSKKSPFEDIQKREIIEHLRKWAVIANNPSNYPILKIKLMKTWLEEVYIEVTTSNSTTRYYFDLATYSLANMSFVDMWG